MLIDRNAKIPAPGDIVHTNGWLRPRLVGHRPVFLVKPHGEFMWEDIERKRRKQDQPVLSDGQVATATHVMPSF